MIWRALALAAVTLAAGSAQAQTIVARSGEHKGFTRLVMRLPDGAAWSLNQSGRSAALNLDAPQAVFDTSRVFDIIPRTRLAAVRQTGPGAPLQLQLGCDCELNSYKQANGYLVIDIRDSRGAPVYSAGSSVLPLGQEMPGSGYRFNLPQNAVTDARMTLGLAASAAAAGLLPAAQPLRANEGYAVRTQEASPDRRQPAGALPLLPAALRLMPQDSAETPPAAKHAAADSAPQEAPDTLPQVNLLLDMEETQRAAAVNVSEHRLLQQIGRAANQGLLELTAGSGGSAPLHPLGTGGGPLDPLSHVSVTTAIDRETGLTARDPDDRMRPDHCLPDRALAIYDWGTESPFADQVGPLRAALVREFDDLNPASVMSLARAYLYFGFGAEARAMLALMPRGSLDAGDALPLDAMSGLLDGASLPVNHPFSGQQGCPGAPAFWAALADGSIKGSANTDAIQQTFARLPAHLRVHLGPRLSTLFAEAGDHHMAEAVLRSIGRTGAARVPEISLAEAAVAELAGDTETVAEALTEAVAGRTPKAPQALIDLIALSYKERKALSPDVPDLVASYEVENRDSGLGARLRGAEVAALALTGQFHQAFSGLQDLTRRDGPAARAGALEPLMTLLAERADDVSFLQYALVFSAQATSAEAAPVAEPVARRLLDLGFAEQAQALLRKLALEPGNEHRRLMMAEAALALNKPHRALVELMGIEGSEANRLRAEALWRNGEYGRAGEYMLAEKDANAAARGFWHSQDLEAIGAMEADADAPFRQVAGVTEQIGETAKDPEGLTPLAHARALVESSEGTRGSIAELLNRLSAGTGEAGTGQ